MKKFLLLIAATAFALLTTACTDSSGYTYETVKNDPLKTRIYTLDNGLKVYMSVNKAEPRIETYIAVKVGGKNDPSETTGLAHYFEHLMFKGTQQFGTSNYEAEKPLLDQIEQLFEVYRKTTDDAERAAIYRQIDSISYEASKYAIPNEYDKLMSAIGALETNANTSMDGLYRKHSFEPDRELGQDPGRPLQERRDPRIPHRARNDLRGEKHVPDGRQP